MGRQEAQSTRPPGAVATTSAQTSFCFSGERIEILFWHLTPLSFFADVG
jgi:hypothetical protein